MLEICTEQDLECYHLREITKKIAALHAQNGCVIVLKAKEEESHLIAGNCEVYGAIQAKYDILKDDNDLVHFFNDILAKRDELDMKTNENET